MKCYETYKAFGLDWLERIPLTWRVDRIKDLAEIITGNTPPKDEPDNYYDGTIPWIKPDQLRGSVVYDSDEKLSDKGTSFARLVPKNAILVGCIGDVGNFAIAGCSLATNQQINSLVFGETIDKSFSKYLIEHLKDEHKKHSTLVVVPILNKSRQGQIYLIIPDKESQSNISAYLDKQCAAIDKVLESKREQLTVLEDLRKSIIHKAVTKGLDDSVEMKDSGIECIGKVPKHWVKEKLFRICQIVSSGGTPSTFEPDYYDGDIIWVQTGDLNDGYIEETEKTITEAGLLNSSAKLFPAGTLIIALYGATIGKLGILMKESATNQACCAMVFYPWMEAKYFFYLFFDYRDVLISRGYGGGQNNISQGTIKQTYFCFPKCDEQVEIVKYLDKECKRIENLRKNLSEQISTLEQYRASLIHECVTGKRRITEEDLKELANV